MIRCETIYEPNPFRTTAINTIPQSKIIDEITKYDLSGAPDPIRFSVEGSTKWLCKPVENPLFMGDKSTWDVLRSYDKKEDKEVRSLKDKKIKRMVIECEDGSTYAGKVAHICGSPYRFNNLCVEAVIEDKPIAAYGIENVIFQNPATIVFWSDGTKTVVNCMDNVEDKKKIVDGKEVIIRKPRKCDTYSKEAGLAMAIVKKWAGNNGNYNNIFRKFIPEMAEEEKAAKKAKKAQKAEK